MQSVRIPVIFKLLAPLVAGILCSYFFKLSVPLSVVLFFAGFLAVTLIYKGHRPIFQVTFMLLATIQFFCLGSYLENQSQSKNAPTYFANHIQPDTVNFFQLKLISYPVFSEKWVRFEAQVLSTNSLQTSGKAQVYFERDRSSETLHYGDLIYTHSWFYKVNEPANPFEFNYRDYLSHHDIHHQAFVKSERWKKCGNDGNALMAGIFETRLACTKIIDASGMSETNSAVAKALLLGDKEMINDELMLSYAASGTLHVLAVSGLHVGIVMLILTFLLQPVKRLKKGKILFLFLVLGGIWFYTLLTGFSPSILRAAVMFTFVLVGNEMQRDTSVYQSLLFSAFVLIIFDPRIIFQVGFLLSYLAVFGIIFFHPKIYGLHVFKHVIPDKIWQVTSVSIAAQLATFPLAIYCFHQFPNYFLFANLIVIPVSFLILITGLAALIFYAVPFLGEFLFYVTDLLISVMNYGVQLTERLPFALTENLIIKWYDVLLLYALLLAVTFTLIKKSIRLLYISFGFSTVLLISLIQQKSERNSTNMVIFYSVKDATVVDVFSSSSLVSFSTKNATDDEKKMKFHIWPARVALGTSVYPDKEISISDSSALHSIFGNVVLFLNQHIASEQFSHHFPVVDLVYFYDIRYIDDRIMEIIKSKKIPVILGNGLDKRFKKFVIQSLSSDRVYDTGPNGALVIYR